jgi:tRNA (uracil-5-)-methyltransferase TRM9
VEPDVRAQLQELTADFYRFHAHSFDESRKGAWNSWGAILNEIRPFKSILDLGCGNGRFAAFLDEHVEDFDYTGIDAEPAFIDAARARYPSHTFTEAQLDNEIDGSYDAIVSFGVFHHVPGFNERVALLQRLAKALRNGGHIAVSLWQPLLLDNFDKKVALRTVDGVEHNDYLLGWNGDFDHVRYCHHFDEPEITDLIESSDLCLVRQFQGTNNDRTNHYIVLEK